MSAGKKSSKCKEFNVGDAVQLRKSSGSYHKDNNPQGEDPIKTKGTVVANDGTIVYPLKIEWSNGQWNWYNHEDLKLWKEESKDTTDKSEEIETPCVKTPVPGTKYEVVLDLWSWNFKKGDILVFKRIDRDGTWEFEGVNTVCDRLQWLRPDYTSSVVRLVVDAEVKDTETSPSTEETYVPVKGDKFKVISNSILVQFTPGDIVEFDYCYGETWFFRSGDVTQQVSGTAIWEQVERVITEEKNTPVEFVVGKEYRVVSGSLLHSFSHGDIVKYVDISPFSGNPRFCNSRGILQALFPEYVEEIIESLQEEDVSLVIGEEYEVINEDHWNFKIGDKVVYLGKSVFGWEFGGIVDGEYASQYISHQHKTPYRVKKIVKSDNATTPTNVSVDLVVGDLYEVIGTRGWHFEVGEIVEYLGLDCEGDWEFNGKECNQVVYSDYGTVNAHVKKVDVDHEKLLADLKTQIESQCLDLMKGTPFKTLEVTSFELPELTEAVLSAIEATLRGGDTEVDVTSPVNVTNKVSVTPTYNLNVGNLDLSALTREQLCLIFDAIEEVL